MRSQLLLLAITATACGGVELDRADFACNAGGPCPHDAGLVDRRDANVRSDAGEEEPDLGINTAPYDAGRSDSGANVVDAGAGDAGSPDAASLCNSGPSGTWTRLSPTGATPRSGHSAVVDSAHSRVLIFGGSTSSDLVSLSLGGTPALQTVAVAGSAPSARKDHSAVIDPVRNIMLLFGGVAGSGSALQDTWSFSLANDSWAENSIVPSARDSMAATYSHDHVYLFGGCTISGPQEDFWMFDEITESWQAWIELFGPDERCDAASVALDADTMLIHGGWDNNGALADLWVIGGIFGGWEELSRGPSARSGHTAVFDSTHGRTLFFGGKDANGAALDELWALKINSRSSHCWEQLTPGGPDRPSARSGHVTFMYGGKMYLYGGTGNSVLDDLWELTF